MRLIHTDSFKRDYSRLSSTLKRRLENKLELFIKNPFHPSLRVKKMKGVWGERGVWEASFTKG